MHNWSDEEMDRLSREAAERYTPPSADGGWEALSRRLDVEMPVKSRKRRAFFWLFFAALLLGGTVYWSNTHQGKAVTEEGQQLAVAKRSTSEKSAAQASVPATAEEPVRATSPSTSTVRPVERTDSRSEQVSSNTSFRKGPADRVVHGPAAGVSQGTGTDRKSKVKQYQGKVPPAEAGNGNEPPVPARSAGGTSGQSPVNSGQEASGQKASGQSPVNSGQEASGQKTSAQSPVNSGQEASGQSTVVGEQKPLTTAASPKVNQEPTTNNQEPTTNNQQPTTKNQQPSRKPGRWEFSLAFAPDLSAVEFYGLSKVGIMGGGTIGYHISERWTVSTGLYYTQKNYSAPGDAYHLPGYWANNPAIKMKTVDAICNMWDIPLNVRYDFSMGRNMRFFASTGLSSYLMRKEDMHYYYTYNNNPYDKSYVYNKNKDYWFAIANISAGMERSIGKGFSVQAEPFAKFSLAEVGTGKIKLNSYGLFVGLKYRPFKVVHPHH